MNGGADIFLTGAAGSVGRHVAEAARARGFAVRGFLLPGEDAGFLEGLGVAIQRGHVEDGCELEAASAGTTHAVHCAALLPHLSHLGKAAFERVNVGGPRNLLDLATRRGWRRVVFLSTCGVLARPEQGPSTDETVYRDPFDLYTWSKIEAEKLIVRTSRERSIPSLILRPANIYGPGMAYRWPELFALVESGRMKLIDRGRAPFRLVHVRDVARAVLAALDERLPIPPGERILVTSPEVHSFASVVGAVAGCLGAPPPGNVPYRFALAAAYLARVLPRPLRRGRLAMLDPAVVREYRAGFDFDTSKAERMLGFRAEESFAEAIGEAVAAWKEGRA